MNKLIKYLEVSGFSRYNDFKTLTTNYTLNDIELTTDGFDYILYINNNRIYFENVLNKEDDEIFDSIISIINIELRSIKLKKLLNEYIKF
jgi:hypothetical protein